MVTALIHTNRLTGCVVTGVANHQTCPVAAVRWPLPRVGLMINHTSQHRAWRHKLGPVKGHEHKNGAHVEQKII